MAVTISASPLTMVRLARVPASLHSPVRNPPMFELTAIAPMNNAHPTDGPSRPSMVAEVEMPHSTVLPEYMPAISTTTSQYAPLPVRYLFHVSFLLSRYTQYRQLGMAPPASTGISTAFAATDSRAPPTRTAASVMRCAQPVFNPRDSRPESAPPEIASAIPNSAARREPARASLALAFSAPALAHSTSAANRNAIPPSIHRPPGAPSTPGEYARMGASTPTMLMLPTSSAKASAVPRYTIDRPNIRDPR